MSVNIDSRGVTIVSIHAPARGATFGAALSIHSRWFQSTRPRGARHVNLTRAREFCQRFNPRAREGRDDGLMRDARRLKEFQSTRPRGARRTRPAWSVLTLRFQSTRPRGARRRPRRSALTNLLFQSTRPRGARPLKRNSTRRHFCFNPRAREGRDGDSFAASPAFNRFNPRAREGRDIRRVSGATPARVSIHAPARGATFAPRI